MDNQQQNQVVPSNLGAPFLIIPNALPPAFLAEVQDYVEQFGEKEHGRVGVMPKDPNMSQEEKDMLSFKEEIRSCDISWIGPKDERSQAIYQQIDSMLVEAARNYFGFDVFVGGTEAIQYTEYNFKEEKEVKDHYGWHMDSMLQGMGKSDRKLSFTIQLTHHADYTGCDFEFPNSEGDDQWDRDLVRTKGTAIIFPSFMTHRVTPITGGTRKSLVGWLRGPLFR